MIIPINLNKKLGDLVVEKIRQKIANLTYISEVFPCVLTGTRDDGQTYPKLVNDGAFSVIDLTPNTQYKSYVFFEKNTYNLSNNIQNKNEYNFNLIFWGDLKSIDGAKLYDFTDEILKDIVVILRGFSATNLSVEFNDVFSNYSLYDTNKQMFMYPYTAFKINFTVKGNDC